MYCLPILYNQVEGGRVERLDEDQLDELQRRLNFTRDDQQCKDVVGSFLALLRLLRESASLLKELEKNGHPSYQMRVEEMSVCRGDINDLKGASENGR